MAAFGVPEADIARVLVIDPKTLRKHYRDELDTGHVKATAKVAEFLFRKATTEGPQCVTAAIFWMKTRARWREVSVHEHAGVPDRPITEIRRIILTPLTEANRPKEIEGSALPDRANTSDLDWE